MHLDGMGGNVYVLFFFHIVACLCTSFRVCSVCGTPGRLFVMCFGLISSADFGLSKIIDDQVTMKTVCGTPGYCGKLVWVNTVNRLWHC